MISFLFRGRVEEGKYNPYFNPQKHKTQNSKLKTYKKSFYETKKNSFYLSPIGIGDIGLFLV